MDLDFGIIRYVLAADEYGCRTEIQLSAGLEKQRAGAVPAGRDNHRPAARRRCGVDRPLESLSLNIGHTGNDAVVEHGETLGVSQGWPFRGLEEPLVDRSAVRPGLLLLAGGKGRQAQYSEKCEEDFPFHFFFPSFFWSFSR